MDARKEYGSITLLCFFHSDPLEVTVDTPGTQPTVEGSLKVESSPHADMLPAGPSVPGPAAILDTSLLSASTRIILETQTEPTEPDWREICKIAYETHKKASGSR